MPNFRTAFLAGLAGAVWVLVGLAATTRAQIPAARVAVSTVVERTLSTGQTFVGTVIPLKKSVVGSAADGRVSDFPVDEGMRVKKGQVLAQLRTESLEIELAGVEAELRLRRDELEELVNGSRPEELEQAKALMLGAKSLMEYTTAKHSRTQTLFERGTVTQDEVQESRAAAIQAEQSFLESKAAHDLAVKGPRRERIAQAQARVLMQSKAVDRIEDEIAIHEIVSPFDGYIIVEHTEVGQWLGKGDPVAEVVQLDEVYVQASVLAGQAVHLRRKTKVRIEVPALPEHVFTGKVALIVPQADVRSRTLPVKIHLNNQIDEEGPLLKSGMLARVDLPTGEKKKMTLVPKDALVLGSAQPVVFVVDAASNGSTDAVVRAVEVELGVAAGTLIQVDGALQRGNRVVVRGNERIRTGQKVTISEELPPDASPSR